METLCATRALKVIKYLRRTVPKNIRRSSVKALEKLPPHILANLHAVTDMKTVTKSAKLQDWLATNPIPVARASVPDPLFNGTLVFVRLTLNRQGQPPFGVAAADIQTALNYAVRAVVPVQRYASQYGTTSLSVSPTILPFAHDLTGNTFSDDDVQGWVDRIVSDNHLSRACIVILHDSSVAGGPSNTFNGGKFGGYHSMSDDGGHPYCFCRVFGTGLSIRDVPTVYAQILSHEIGEMAVDPNGKVNNPEVCDACAGNCNNNQFDLFDNGGNFIGGTTDPNTTPTPFSFYINSVIQPEFYNPDTECAIPGSNLTNVCVYPPPPAWQGPGDLTTVANLVSVAGHFSTGDQRHLVVVGTSQGKVHEIFWKPAQVGIEGHDDLPVTFGGGTIVSVGSLYNSDQNRHVVLVGKKDGKVHEIFWKPETVGVEGHDDLPVTFGAGKIAAVSGLYDNNQQRHIVVVGTTAGKVHEIFWKADTVGVEGHDDLPVTFAAGSIVGVTAFYNSDQQQYVVVVGTHAGKLHEIFWKATTAGVEGHDDLPVSLGSSIVAVSGFYDTNKQRHVVVVGTADGKVHQIYWKASTVGIEAHSTVAQFSAGSIRSVAGFYSSTDQIEHIAVGLSNGAVRELFVRPDV